MRVLCYLLLPFTLLAGQIAYSAGLQVTPIVLDINQTQKSDGVWLANTSNIGMDVQVRVFEWTQSNQTDVLSPTAEFVASPPLVKISSGQKQFVRLVRVGQQPAFAERAYRIVVDELPLERANSKGLTFALRYSIPVFIAGAAGSTPPSLVWKVDSNQRQVFLTIRNSGSTRAKLSSLKFISKKGHAHTVNEGLFGYALANSSRRWGISNNPDLFRNGGRFEVMINGKAVQIPIAGF